MNRVGIGYDVHRFSRHRKLILGGVEIPFELGLEGHSDADVLTHAICDAILGAIGERDIGDRFPDSDPTYKDISSLVLLREILREAKSKGFRILNLDTVVVCERPKIAGYVDQIKRSLSSCLEIDEVRLGIKATSTDGIGFTGRLEGIAAQAIVLLEEN